MFNKLVGRNLNRTLLRIQISDCQHPFQSQQIFDDSGRLTGIFY